EWVAPDSRSLNLRSKCHLFPPGAEIPQFKARSTSVPPECTGGCGIREFVLISARRVPFIKWITRVSVVVIAFQIPTVIGLDQRDFIIGMNSVGHETLVVDVTQFVDMPHQNSGPGDLRIAPCYLAVLNDEILPTK